MVALIMDRSELVISTHNWCILFLMPECWIAGGLSIIKLKSIRLHYHQKNLQQYFKTLSDKSELPAFKDLKVAAKNLYQKYTSSRAQQRAMFGLFSTFDPSSPLSVPLGAQWSELQPTPSSSQKRHKQQLTNSWEIRF